MDEVSRAGTEGKGAARGDGPAVSRLAWWTLAVALVCGAVLRLVCPADIEWKKDEQWSYRMSREAGPVSSWPPVGMETSLSQSFRNPGLSVWVFMAAGRLAPSPMALARWVEVSSVLALIGFAAAARAWVPAAEREPWIWGIALQAVNPTAVRIARKIWPPSVLPPFLLALWAGHLNRTKRWGACTWGLAGALIGQIHLSGWYLAAGVAAGTVLAELRGAPRTRWGWWLLGSVLGLLPAIPWACTLHDSAVVRTTPVTLSFLLMHFYICSYYLIFFTLGTEFDRGLGLQFDVSDFLGRPILPDGPSFLMSVLHWGILYAFVAFVLVLLLRLVLAAIRRVRRPSPKSDSRAGYPLIWFYALWTLLVPICLYGITIEVYFYHYFYVFLLFSSVLLAALVLPWRSVLLVMVLCNATISTCFLSYVHDRGGAFRGEFGLTLARQLKDHTIAPPRFEKAH